ncbi:dTDP-4-amino-4,6-dideoxygalactose transaminase [Methylophilales bacterium]|nr:dTDP-4-amino-4,6-dideoxygalactose transaminase [Methylophilales bacterium]
MIPFNKISYSNLEIKFIKDALEKDSISGGGYFSKKCEKFINKKFNFHSYLTTSCTASIEVATLLGNFVPGDEIIMPSYTFVGSATPFTLRGCIPVFVDINPDTQNIDEDKIEESITKKTKAILVVHYAGISCDIDKIITLCKKYNLILIEDAAQALGSKYKNKFLGSFGEISTFSFHDTKNITSGEGGLININEKNFISRAQIIIEKGTDRSKFLRGMVDKYTWQDIGSSFIPSELNAAFLYAQLLKFDDIQKERKKIWSIYKSLFDEITSKYPVQLPFIPAYCEQNYHMFYVKLPSYKKRENAINYLKQNNIQVVSHYQPLHSSPAGKVLCRFSGEMRNTNNTSNTLIRLPLYIGLKYADQENIINLLIKSLSV